MKSRRLLIALLLCLTPALPALAQDYPSRPIRLIVPFAPGGGTDFVARATVPKMGEALGQPIVIENRGGANGVIGSDAVAKAAPDGYTLLLGAAGTLVVAPHLGGTLPFQPLKDFAPISLFGISPFVVTVHPSVPVSDLRQLITLAKAQPGSLVFGSSGNGGAPHLATELFKSMAGVDMRHVPYKGLAPAVADLLGGQIQLLFADVGLVLPHIKSGKLKALAITSARRASVLPDVPSVAEAGVPGYEASTWYGLLAPAGTPAAIVERLSAEAAKALQARDLVERFAAQGVLPGGNTPSQFRAHIEKESSKWQKVIRDAGIKLE